MSRRALRLLLRGAILLVVVFGAYAGLGRHDATTAASQVKGYGSKGFVAKWVSSVPTVDLKGNGVDGPLTVSPGTPVYLTWTSTSADTCTGSGFDTKGEVQNLSGVTVIPTTQTTYTITCTGPGGSATDSVTVIPFGYTLGNSGDIRIAQGVSGSVSMIVTHTGGTPQRVDFSTSLVTGLPEGVTPSFGATGCTPPRDSSCSVSLTLSVGSAVVPGSYRVTVQDNGPEGHTTSFNLTVFTSAATFTFTLNHDRDIRVAQGASATNTIIVANISSAPSQVVSLSVTSSPITGVSSSFAPASCDPDGSSCTSILTMRTTGGADATPKGTYTVTVTGVAGSQTAQTSFTLYVSVPNPTFKEIKP